MATKYKTTDRLCCNIALAVLIPAFLVVTAMAFGA